MDLVVDANIVFGAMISVSNETRDMLFSEKIRLFAPELLIEECRRHSEEIRERAGFTEYEFELFISIVSSRINFIPVSEFESLISEAEKVCPDPKDIEYFAVALKFGCPIWSNDLDLKKQKFVKVLQTAELAKIIS